MTAGQSAAGRDVESINEEAVAAVADAIWGCDGWADGYPETARAALAAALPLLRLSDVPGLERQLRDKIAGEAPPGSQDAEPHARAVELLGQLVVGIGSHHPLTEHVRRFADQAVQVSS